VLACAVAAAALSPAYAAKSTTSKTGLQPVVFAGNNWEGTADVLRFTPPSGSKPGGFTRLARLNIIPDYDERMAEIATNPERLAYFLAIRELVGEGHDQFVDDAYSTNDGTHLIVSRPSFADVVSLKLTGADAGGIEWRFPVAGQRADHMGLSPDGKYVAVSASTGNVVHILDTQTGAEVSQFPSGDSPHENTYSRDGTRIYHASIGRVYTPTDQPAMDTTKGDDHFQIVNVSDPANPVIEEQIDMAQKLEEAGYPDMSGAVRPMALSPDEHWIYFQVSFFHGFVEYSFDQDRVTRLANLPNLVPDMPREQYLLDSAHHGIAMNGDGTKLCVAGTMDDYAAIVSRATLNYTLIKDEQTTKPYWVTDSPDGKYCFISWSTSDRLSALSYEKEKEVARIEVGSRPDETDHPQRVRNGFVPSNWIPPAFVPPEQLGL
jgi:hypothetical protein